MRTTTTPATAIETPNSGGRQRDDRGIFDETSRDGRQRATQHAPHSQTNVRAEKGERGPSDRRSCAIVTSHARHGRADDCSRNHAAEQQAGARPVRRHGKFIGHEFSGGEAACDARPPRIMTAERRDPCHGTRAGRSREQGDWRHDGLRSRSAHGHQQSKESTALKRRTTAQTHGRSVIDELEMANDYRSAGPVFIDDEIFELNCKLKLFGVRV